MGEAIRNVNVVEPTTYQPSNSRNLVTTSSLLPVSAVNNSQLIILTLTTNHFL